MEGTKKVHKVKASIETRSCKVAGKATVERRVNWAGPNSRGSVRDQVSARVDQEQLPPSTSSSAVPGGSWEEALDTNGTFTSQGRPHHEEHHPSWPLVGSDSFHGNPVSLHRGCRALEVVMVYCLHPVLL